MRHTTAMTLSTVLLWSAAGCLGLLPKKTQKDNERELSEQDKREIRAWGGEELLTDTEQLLKTAPKGDPIFSCLDGYMRVAKTEKELASKEKENDMLTMNVNQRCEKECAEAGSGSYASYASKYGGRCKEKAAVAGKSFYLKQANLAIEAMRKSDSPLDWFENARGVKADLERSKEGLGTAGGEIDPLFVEYDKLVLAHRKEIDKAKAFLDRDDILDMQQQARIMDEELRVLRKRYNERHWDSTADLIRVTQARRDALDERYRREGMKAGVLKDRRP